MDYEICAECRNKLKVSKNRDECLDMCNNCWNALNERVKRMSDPDYRMAVTRSAVAWVNELYHSNHKEAQLRAFFGSVMPEVPQYKVEKLIRNNT